MSVTFSVVQEPTGYVLACGCGASTLGPFSSYDESNEARSSFVYMCDDVYCAAYAPMSVAVYAYEESVNVSNVNAKHILETLGIDTTDLAGMLEGHDFLGRVLVADALSVGDPGVPVVQDGNFIECGRSEGYTESRLSELRVIAQFASEQNKAISWG